MPTTVDVATYDSYRESLTAIASATTEDDLERAIDAYVASSTSVLEAVDDEGQLAALVAGDLRVLAHVTELDPDDDEEDMAVGLSVSTETASTLGFDLGLVAEGVLSGGSPPPGPDDLSLVALSEETGKEAVLGAVDGIFREATTVATKVVAAVSIPTGDDIVAIAGQIGGQSGAELAQRVIEGAGGLVRKLRRMAAKVVGALVDKLAKFLGEERVEELVEKVRTWLSDMGDRLDLLGLVLGRNALEQAVEAMPGGDAQWEAELGERARGLVDRHADVQRWIGWGAAGLAAARKLKLDKLVAPWGPVLVGAAGVLLLGACVVTANDFLDGREWPPHRVEGIRSLVGVPVP